MGVKIEGVVGEIFPYRSKEGAQAVKPSKGTIGFPSESVEDALFNVPLDKLQVLLSCFLVGQGGIYVQYPYH